MTLLDVVPLPPLEETTVHFAYPDGSAVIKVPRWVWMYAETFMGGR